MNFINILPFCLFLEPNVYHNETDGHLHNCKDSLHNPAFLLMLKGCNTACFILWHAVCHTYMPIMNNPIVNESDQNHNCHSNINSLPAFFILSGKNDTAIPAVLLVRKAVPDEEYSVPNQWRSKNPGKSNHWSEKSMCMSLNERIRTRRWHCRMQTSSEQETDI